MKEFHHMTQEELRAVVDDYTAMTARVVFLVMELDTVRVERDRWLKNYQAELYEKEQAQEHAHAMVGERDALAQQAEDAVGRNVALLEENRLLNNILDALERLFEDWKAQRAAERQEHV